MLSKLSILVISLPLLGACSYVSWPEHRGGGMAEITPRDEGVMLISDNLDKAHILYDQLALFEAGLEDLVQKGAFGFARAETTLAQKLIIRIRREIAGDLLIDAEKDLISLRARLSRIQDQLGPQLRFVNL